VQGRRASGTHLLSLPKHADEPQTGGLGRVPPTHSEELTRPGVEGSLALTSTILRNCVAEVTYWAESNMRRRAAVSDPANSDKIQGL